MIIFGFLLLYFENDVSLKNLYHIQNSNAAGILKIKHVEIMLELLIILCNLVSFIRFMNYMFIYIK